VVAVDIARLRNEGAARPKPHSAHILQIVSLRQTAAFNRGFITKN
jgi:hypothetical protein